MTVRATTARWSIAYPPASGDLLATSCVASSACVTVGGGFGPIVARWNGATWGPQASADPAAPTAMNRSTLSGVSCADTTTCIAVGTYDDDRCDSHGCSAATLPFAERSNAATWTLQPTPTPAGSGPYSGLNAISCPSPNACVAVGYRDDERQLAERWDGVRWSIQSTANRPGVLTSVACTSADACTAVGYAPSGRASRPLAEHWDGLRWAIQDVPSPGRGSQLEGVSCTASNACTAVGQSFQTARPIAGRWDGHRWSLQTTPDVGPDADLSSVSCPLSATCIAVGSSYATAPPAGDASTLVERWDGSSWTRERTPNSNDANNPGSYLHAVSCTTSAVCTAVGNDGANRALALQRTTGPSAGFAVTDIQTTATGTLTLHVKVPAPGQIELLETAWNTNLALGAALLQPAPRRFVYARADASAASAGAPAETVTPNQQGQELVAHHRYQVTLRLWVRYTPHRGPTQTLGFTGLHLP